ncbi:transmembrane channel-like protein 3 isoform X3 [Bolinopsis microptera]|uniref:transmembrane channel-like protein 3 isoform X3 n=1 Tax=Bolinopsis microptera TaxID=2820187 RepID=UPI003078D462
MVKRNTIEVDDAEDLVDDDLVDDNLVDEELEILLREQATKEAENQINEPVPAPAPKLVSRQTQTVNLTISDREMNMTQLQVPGATSARTLTRQLRTGRGTIKRSTMQKSAMNVHMVTDEDEEEVDTFHKMEAGISDNRIRRDNKRAHMGWFQLLVYDLKLAIERQKQERYEFPLFLKSIKTIQGELGSSTAALFLFVRYLLMINIGSAIFWVGFVVIPQAIYFDYSGLSEESDPFTGIQLFLGTGRVAKSWLFFSGYEEVVNDSYMMYVAYLVIHFTSIFVVFFAILQTIGNDTIRDGSKSQDQVRSLAMNLFASWDYSINSHDAIEKQQKSTGSNFKDLLCELTSAKKERTIKEQRIILALRILAWFIWAILIAGAITAIIFVVDRSDSEEGGFFNVYGPTIALTAINGAVPFLMQQLTLIESYDIGRTEQYVTLTRVYVMRMISLITFIVTLIKAAGDSGSCPQLYWGQEFYKLVIINTLSNCAALSKYPAFYYLLNKKTEVDLPSTLMSLIYFQGCIWFGNLFCPLLSAMGIISNLIYFAISSALIKSCCQPPTKRYNSNNSMFFNLFLAITIILMFGSTVFIIVSISVDCGPWKSPKFDNMWDTWGEMSEGWNTQAREIVHVILSAAVVVPVVFILSIVVWLLRIMNEKMTLRNEIMGSELNMLRIDKANFLKEKRLGSNGNGNKYD